MKFPPAERYFDLCLSPVGTIRLWRSGPHQFPHGDVRNVLRLDDLPSFSVVTRDHFETARLEVLALGPVLTYTALQ